MGRDRNVEKREIGYEIKRKGVKFGEKMRKNN